MISLLLAFGMSQTEVPMGMISDTVGIKDLTSVYDQRLTEDGRYLFLSIPVYRIDLQTGKSLDGEDLYVCLVKDELIRAVSGSTSQGLGRWSGPSALDTGRHPQFW